MKANTRKPAVILLVLATLILLAYLFSQKGAKFRWVTRAEFDYGLTQQTEILASHTDARCNAIEAKLDRIEAKLDRLLDLASAPTLPDGMRQVE